LASLALKAICAIGVLLLAAACHVPSSGSLPLRQEPTATLNPAYVDRSLITGDPCAAPCWMGIQPGLATPEEAERLIASLPYVSNESADTVDSDWIDGGLATFVVHHCSFHPNAPCITYAVVGGLVVQLHIDALFDMSFGDVVDALGPPDYYYVDRPSFNPYCNVGLVWLDRSLTIGGGQKDLDFCDHAREAGLGANEPVEDAVYTAPSEMPGFIQPGRDLPWTGFAQP
jgi:hypothetical protein